MDKVGNLYEEIILSIRILLDTYPVDRVCWEYLITRVDRDFQLYVGSFLPILDQLYDD